MDSENTTNEELLKLHRAVESSDEAIFITDINGTINYINPGFTNCYGYSQGDVVGKCTPRILKSGEMDADSYKYFWKEILNKKVVKGELINKTKDGRLINVEGSANPILNDNGEIIGFIGIQRDITEQKKSEEKLLLLADALKGIRECVSITDMHDNVIFLNNAFLATYGFNEEDLKNESIGFIRSPNNSPELVNEILPATITGGWQGEILNLKKDGTEFPVLLSTSVVNNSEGQPIALIGIATDITERKKAEDALRHSEERFRAVTESANDAIISSDSRGIIRGWNRGAAEVFGYNESEIIGKSLRQIIPGDFLKSIIMSRQRLDNWAKKEVVGNTVEVKGLRKNREPFPLELSLAEWKTSDGEFFTGIVRDITKRKRTELENQVNYDITQGVTTTSNLDELLRLVHNSLSKVVYAENIFIALYDKETNLFNFPYFVDKIDEVPPPAAMRKSCTAYVFWSGMPLLLTKDLFEKLVADNKVELVGSSSPSWLGIPLLTPSKTIGVLVLQHYELENVYKEIDIRFLSSIGSQIAAAIERKQSEVALLESEKDLKESQKIAGLGRYKLSFITGQWTSSEILDSIFGIDENYERSIKGWTDLIHPEWQEIMSEYLQKEVIDSRGMFDKDYKIIRITDLSERWVHGKGELIYDSNNELTDMTGNIVDITERKLVEEEIELKNTLLQTINAEKDKFFSILAHDLRGPLSAFVDATQILTEDIQNMSLEEIRDISTSMKTSATNIYTLLENLLEWSRLQRGVMEFNPVEFNLRDKIAECTEVLIESSKKKSIGIKNLIPGGLMIIADVHMFETVVRNLVSNALKFTTIGGTVSIEAEQQSDNSVVIKITDTGIGMPPEVKTKLFLINEKTSRNGTEGEPSTGLGLLICKEFVEKHNGKIWAESETGRGSTFLFTIPVLD